MFLGNLYKVFLSIQARSRIEILNFIHYSGSYFLCTEKNLGNFISLDVYQFSGLFSLSPFFLCSLCTNCIYSLLVGHTGDRHMLLLLIIYQVLCFMYVILPWVRKIPWRREWQPTQCSCLGNPIERSLVGDSPWSS